MPPGERIEEVVAVGGWHRAPGGPGTRRRRAPVGRGSGRERRSGIPICPQTVSTPGGPTVRGGVRSTHRWASRPAGPMGRTGTVDGSGGRRPSPPGGVTQLARVRPLQGRSRGFESHRLHPCLSVLDRTRAISSSAISDTPWPAPAQDRRRTGPYATIDGRRRSGRGTGFRMTSSKLRWSRLTVRPVRPSTSTAVASIRSSVCASVRRRDLPTRPVGAISWSGNPESFGT